MRRIFPGSSMSSQRRRPSRRPVQLWRVYVIGVVSVVLSTFDWCGDRAHDLQNTHRSLMHAVPVCQGRMTALIRCFKKVVKERGSAIIAVSGLVYSVLRRVPGQDRLGFDSHAADMY